MEARVGLPLAIPKDFPGHRETAFIEDYQRTKYWPPILLVFSILTRLVVKSIRLLNLNESSLRMIWPGGSLIDGAAPWIKAKSR